MTYRDYIFNITSASKLNRMLEPGTGVKCGLIKFKTIKQMKEFMKNENKSILMIQPDNHRYNYTLIIIDQELRFWDMTKIPDGDYPQIKCTVCKINEVNDTTISYGKSRNICRDCMEKERENYKKRQLLKFKKDLTSFFKSRKCKYVEFKDTWTYFYKKYKMDRYNFNSNFTDLILGHEIHLNIGLLSTPLDSYSPKTERCFEWQKDNGVDMKYRKGDLFLLWTINGI